MQAALPMYFPPAPALQAFWSALAQRLRDDPAVPPGTLPARLSVVADCHAQWLASDLLLSQACGYPLATQLAGRVQLVGTFAYDVPGVQGMDCRSQLICRAGDPRHALCDFAGSTLALNDRLSQSGYNALRALVATRTTAPRPFFGATWLSGAHYRSIEAVHDGRADMAALDAVSWALWQAQNPRRAAGLRVFDQTEAYPGLPLISALQTPTALLAALRRALHTLATDPAHAAVRAPLRISGFARSSWADYQRCLAMQNAAFSLGLHQL
jgi:ABC-type phosphate/phosphonate transport system substrate-binding protein